MLAPEGVVTIEFPHLARLMAGNQFDTIYHEHFSYFSFLTARAVLRAHGLEVFDVDELATHGGLAAGLRAARAWRPPAGEPAGVGDGGAGASARASTGSRDTARSRRG